MLILAPERSRLYGSALGVAAALAGVAIWISGIPLWAKPILSLVLAAYGVLLWRGGGFAVRLEGADAWSVIPFGAEPLDAELLGSSFASRVCVVLHFATPQGRIAVPVFRDSVDAETYRRLRVHLVCAGAPGRRNGPPTMDQA